MQKPIVINSFLDVTTCYMAHVMFQSTLEEYADQFEIGLATVTRGFLIIGATNMIGLMATGLVRHYYLWHVNVI